MTMRLFIRWALGIALGLLFLTGCAGPPLLSEDGPSSPTKENPSRLLPPSGTRPTETPRGGEIIPEGREITYDMIRFRREYEAFNGQENTAGTRTMKTISIPQMNLIRYITPEEILDIAESGTGLIYFGFPQCPWCRQMTPLLIDVALELGLKTIYYIDMTLIRTAWSLHEGVPVMTDPGHPYYQDLLQALSMILEPMELNPFHLVDPDGNRINTEELRIFVPTVVAIRDGRIVDFHIYTVERSTPGNEGGYQWYPLSDEEEQLLRSIYERVITAVTEICQEEIFVGC